MLQEICQSYFTLTDLSFFDEDNGVGSIPPEFLRENLSLHVKHPMVSPCLYLQGQNVTPLTQITDVREKFVLTNE